ncbi:sensor histidine kinase [Nocardioides sp. CFH 31398]|uniref:sensor histidine kinase n=1 Tax=Nocardioides sp. CFH 31398 TaxID=2919579 RepID=UPI001F05453A|nr:histidine kinase [Nocardioides sp. CFH 31398]MCH1865261.1 histidine kinase [Nocardioides sp. CFH 31398]
MSTPAVPAAPPLRPWLAALALLVMAGTAGSNAADGRARLGPALLLAAVAVLPVLLAARRPGPPLVVNGLALAAYLALGLASGPVFLTVALTTYVVAREHRPRAWGPWAAAALVLVGAGGVLGVLRGEREAVSTGWPWLAMVALVVAAGALASLTRARAEARRERADRAAAEERLRMAQDLHDGVGHGLAVVAMQAGVALHVLDRDPGAARASLEAIRDASRDSLDRLRSELDRLAGVEDAAAPRRPEPGLADVAATVERVRRGGPAVDLRADADGVRADVADLDVPPEVGETAHRVVQEALTNVLRHSGARRVTVVLATTSAWLTVEVADDGTGPAAGAGRAGLGLAGLRRRVSALGGMLEAGPGRSGGFRVEARLPLDGREGR